MAATKEEYYLCPMGNTDKPRMCPAKHMNAGWKCPWERAGDCAVTKIVEAIQKQKQGF
jgi:hypothetical protein